MDWLRLWHDLPNDPKWRAISRKSGQRIGDVLAVYLHMMVQASENDPRGKIESWDDDDVAAALNLEAEDVLQIREAMQGKVLDGERLTGWDRRQPKREDSSKDRVRAYRERKAAECKREDDKPPTEANSVGGETQCNAPVTQGDAPEKIRLDTDKSKREKKPRAKALDFSGWPEMPSDQVLSDYRKVRQAKKAPLTQTVVNTMGKELQVLERSRVSVDQALTIACVRGWQGFKADWVLNHLNSTPARGGPETVDQFKDRNRRQAERVMASGLLDDLPAERG